MASSPQLSRHLEIYDSFFASNCSYPALSKENVTAELQAQDAFVTTFLLWQSSRNLRQTLVSRTIWRLSGA